MHKTYKYIYGAHTGSFTRIYKTNFRKVYSVKYSEYAWNIYSFLYDDASLCDARHILLWKVLQNERALIIKFSPLIRIIMILYKYLELR